MAMAHSGKTVTVQYIGTLDNGRIFSNTEDAPLTIAIGNNEIFPKLEEEILTMQVGEVRNIVLRCDDAYGQRQQGNIIKLQRSSLPAAVRVGQRLSLEFGGKAQRVMLVREVGEEYVTLDGNHPLAGHDLTFALRLIEVDEHRQ